MHPIQMRQFFVTSDYPRFKLLNFLSNFIILNCRQKHDEKLKLASLFPAEFFPSNLSRLYDSIFAYVLLDQILDGKQVVSVVF